jgi:hypothetical protein
MKGGLYIIRQNGEIETREIDRPPTGDEIHNFIDGYIEVVPYWNELVVPSAKIMSKCVAFCDESGKTTGNKPLNERATIMWEATLNRQGKSCRGLDELVGDICVVWGDQELLDNL